METMSPQGFAGPFAGALLAGAAGSAGAEIVGVAGFAPAAGTVRFSGPDAAGAVSAAVSETLARRSAKVPNWGIG